MTAPSPPRPRTLRGLQLLLALLVLVTPAAALAQEPARAATLELGFAGALVADAWNPLAAGAARRRSGGLELAIDRGTLREGERWTRYRTEIPGGSGLSVFEDEVFVPVWRSLSWTVRSGGLTVASGSVPRTQADRRHLDLVVGEPGSAIRALLAGGRTIDVAPDRLPLRSAAYDGVGRLIVAAPAVRPQVLIAAAVAGADVIVTPAAAAEPALAELLPSAIASRAVGAGRLLTAAGFLAEPAHARPGVDQPALVSALAAAERIDVAAPGADAAVAARRLRLFADGAAGAALRRRARRSRRWCSRSRSAWPCGCRCARPSRASRRCATWSSARRGGTALAGARALDAAGAEIVFPVPGWPLADVDARQGPDSIAVDLPRWRSVRVLERPRATAMALVRDGDGELAQRRRPPARARRGPRRRRRPGRARRRPGAGQTRDVRLPELAAVAAGAGPRRRGRGQRRAALAGRAAGAHARGGHAMSELFARLEERLREATCRRWRRWCSPRWWWRSRRPGRRRAAAPTSRGSPSRRRAR
jgi:hypothetical protein